MFSSYLSRSVSYFTNSVPFLMFVFSSGRSYGRRKGRRVEMRHTLCTVSTSLYIYLQVMKGKIIVVLLLPLLGKGSDLKKNPMSMSKHCVYIHYILPFTISSLVCHSHSCLVFHTYFVFMTSNEC